MTTRRDILMGAVGVSLAPTVALAIPSESTVEVLRRNANVYCESRMQIDRSASLVALKANEYLLNHHGEEVFGKMEICTDLSKTIKSELSSVWSWEYSYDGTPPGFTADEYVEFVEREFAQRFRDGWLELIEIERRAGYGIKPFVPLSSRKIIVDPYTFEPMIRFEAVYERVKA